MAMTARERNLKFRARRKAHRLIEGDDLISIYRRAGRDIILQEIVGRVPACDSIVRRTAAKAINALLAAPITDERLLAEAVRAGQQAGRLILEEVTAAATLQIKAVYAQAAQNPWSKPVRRDRSR